MEKAIFGGAIYLQSGVINLVYTAADSTFDATMAHKDETLGNLTHFFGYDSSLLGAATFGTVSPSVSCLSSIVQSAPSSHDSTDLYSDPTAYQAIHFRKFSRLIIKTF